MEAKKTMAIYVKFQTPKEVQDLAYDLVEKARDTGTSKNGRYGRGCHP